MWGGVVLFQKTIEATEPPSEPPSEGTKMRSPRRAMHITLPMQACSLSLHHLKNLAFKILHRLQIWAFMIQEAAVSSGAAGVKVNFGASWNLRSIENATAHGHSIVLLQHAFEFLSPRQIPASG